MIEMFFVNLSKIWEECTKIKKKPSGKEIIIQHYMFLINHISRCITKLQSLI